MATAEELDDRDDALARHYSERAAARGEWAGIPLPARGRHLVLEPRYPFTGIDSSHGRVDFERPSPPVGPAAGPGRLINQWYSRRLGRMVSIVEDATRRRAVIGRPPDMVRVDMAFATMLAAGSWSPRAERRARERLRTLISPGHERSYELTGGFLERSPRSGVAYFLRKLRPTLATRFVPAEGRIRVLAALCLHPVGYYEGSWAGAMTPTDDVIAHLLMIRGCEARFWAKAVHHPTWDPAAGL